jgi:hypothetical protein
LSFPKKQSPHIHHGRITTLVYVGETNVCCAGGDAGRPLHTFDPLFFCKLGGANAEGPYNFEKVKRWVGVKKVGYNIFRCKEWAIPINLADKKHWVLVRVALPSHKSGEFIVRYFDSLRHDQGGETATKVRVRRMHTVLETITVKSFFNVHVNPKTLNPKPTGNAVPQCRPYAN